MVKDKRCFKCLLDLPVSHFYKHKKMADGYLNKCKTCTKIDVQNNYTKSFIARRAYEKARFKCCKRKASVAVYQNKHRKLYPIKYKARNAVNNALRKGKLFKKPCSCGAEKVQAHHADYYKPLEVTWLCFACHRLLHGQANVIC